MPTIDLQNGALDDISLGTIRANTYEVIQVRPDIDSLILDDIFTAANSAYGYPLVVYKSSENDTSAYPLVSEGVYYARVPEFSQGYRIHVSNSPDGVPIIDITGKRIVDNTGEV